MIADSKNIKAGQILYTSWGYEQTNVNFFKVLSVSKTGHSAKLVSICSKSAGAVSGMSENVLPEDEVEQVAVYDKTVDGWKPVGYKPAEPFTVRSVRDHGFKTPQDPDRENCGSVPRGQRLFIHDGRPKYSSWYA